MFNAKYLLVLAAVASLTTAFTLPACKFGVLQRKEWRNLNQEEQLTFISRVNEIHAEKTNGVSFFDVMAKTNVENRVFFEAYDADLPWRRLFLSKVEQKLQEKGQPITLPYWDWVHDRVKPEEAPIWGDGPDKFGRNGSKDGTHGSDGCVTTGGFANMQVTYPRPHCLKRNKRMKREPESEDDITPEKLDQILKTSKNFEEFYSKWRAADDYNYLFIGGDFRSFGSNDPVTFLHDALVDKIWFDFQRSNPEQANKISGKVRDLAQDDDPWSEFPPTIDITEDTVLNGLGATVKATFSTENLCYTY